MIFQEFKQTETKQRGLPTVGAIEWRAVLYPVSRNISTDIRDKTHGEVRVVKGNLTARHRDYLDAILANKEKTLVDREGQLTIIFDDAKVRKILDISATNWEDLRLKLVDMMTTAMAVKKPGSTSKWPDTFPLLILVGECETLKTNHGRGQYETALKKITLSKGMVDLLTNDAVLYINKNLMNFVLGMKHQISRSMAKWLMTHREDQHHSFINMLKYVGADNCSERMQRKYLSQLKDDSDKLRETGITITGGLKDGVIHYIRDEKKVFIELLENGRNQNPEVK